LTSELEQFEKIFRHYRPGLCGFAHSIVNNHSDSEEIVHDVFISVWEKRNNLTLDHGLKSYLFTAVKNRCLNHLKKARLPFAEMPDEFEAKSHTHGADKVLEGRELEKQVTDAINELPPKCKQAFLLSRMYEFSYREIAEVMEISTKTVENQIGIALKHLKHRLGKTRN
jgi:RNA polymerase sigma-70 factor (ECF subfamily)